MVDANCAGKAPNRKKDPDAKDPWFPGKGESPNPGKIACFTCPVRPQCDDYRKRTDSRSGMWAGVIGKEDDD